MATNGGSSRDAAARRRRIAERGSERLALITGRVQSISSSPLTPPVAQPHHSSTAPCPPSISRNSDQVPTSDENTVSPLNTETAGDDVENDVQPVMPKCETITETYPQPSFTPSNTQSFSTTLTEPNPPISTSNKSQKSESQTRLHETLTPNRIRPAITASQDIRKICSVITALLVLFSYAGFPILGSDIIKNLVLSRPLILLLLTNITIVAAPLLLEKVKQKERRGSAIGETGFASNLGTALEWGMLMKTGTSALFMDCSVYSVVVICGISFLQKLGW
ncbi:uncharacterized protein LOC112520280 [Cynara cardunculus var. scolymus]|uniref:Uncharacterized protein n=1 Tax=Cynara cardunculus var. scolymus TaxID=59895 RepID=A0A103XZR3_CYNCS|nr:uncharacterized protein LOC112520280 [Cynara cardunculus var. scolymus]KVH99873.1 hypothetical protein Ccrd_021874 [Cynara cardunculus var. scolymus]